jgi:hypothetical protein
MTKKEALSAGSNKKQIADLQPIIAIAHGIVSPTNTLGAMQGIYLIASTKNDRPIIYIGSTWGLERSFQKRFTEHLKELKSKSKRSTASKTTRWQYHYLKHGSDDYVYYALEIIGPLAGVDFVRERETYHIQKWREKQHYLLFNAKNCDGYGFNGSQADDPIWQAGIARRSADPVWIANQAAGALANSKDPKWIASQAAGAKKAIINPVAMSNRRAATRKLTQSPTWLENHAAAMKKNAKDPEWLAKNANSGKN